MDIILALVGLGIVVWALSALFSPPRKHKDFSLRDQDEGAIRGSGGSPPADLSKLEPEEMAQKGRKQKN